MRCIALEHAVTNLALRILDQKATLCTFNKDDDRNKRDSQNDNAKDQTCGQSARTAQFQRTGNSVWKVCDNTGENYERNTVTDTARSDLLTQPHQEHRATNERDDRRNQEHWSRICNDAVTRLKTNRNRVSLHKC